MPPLQKCMCAGAEIKSSIIDDKFGLQFGFSLEFKDMKYF